MTAYQVHKALKNDEAYIWSRDNNDIGNMMLVLSAHGFNSTINHAIVMINFSLKRCPEQTQQPRSHKWPTKLQQEK